MRDELYARADPDGVIARFAAVSPIARSPEGAYVAWRFSLRDGLAPADAAAVVLAAGAGRWRRAPHLLLRRLLERTSGGRRHPANDDHASEGT